MVLQSELVPLREGLRLPGNLAEAEPRGGVVPAS
jgi:hypothetical protein